MVTNLLLVEDQKLVRAGMKSMLNLTSPQCRVVDVGSYAEAIEQLQRESFEVVLLDLNLQESRSGMDLLAYIRAHELAVRVVILSATDDEHTVMSCISAGASGYIAKAVGDESVFNEALTVILEGGIYLPPSLLERMAPPVAYGATDGRTLSPRLLEVLYYLCQGLPNKSIASRMGISEGTVRKNYVSELLRFFNVARRTALIVEVSRRGIKIPPPPGATRHVIPESQRPPSHPQALA